MAPEPAYAVPLSFAIGVSPGPRLGARDPEGDDALETLARDGVNLIRLPKIDEQELIGRMPGTGPLPPSVQLAEDNLDWALRAGRAAGKPVYVAINLGELSTQDGSARRRRWLEYVVERFRDHPATGVWKVLDEPNNPYTPDEKELQIRRQLRRGYQRLKELDPAHLAWVTQAPLPAKRVTTRFLRTYRETADIFAVDLYPVSDPVGRHSGLRNKQPSAVGEYAARLATIARERTAAGQPAWVWMVLQGAAWSGVIPRDAQRRYVGPCLMQPPRHLTRYMAYQSIIKGAQGLLYFGLNVGLHADSEPLGWDWGYWRGSVLPLLRELRSPDLASALAAAYPDAAPRSGSAVAGTRSAPGVESRAMVAPDGSRITLAARRERLRGEAHLRAVAVPVPGPRNGEADVLFENRRVPVREGAVVDRFAPWEVHCYRVGS